MTDSGHDDPEPVVHPTQDDPVAAALSRSVGGPVGDHAGRHPWWTPVRVVLAMVAVVCALGFVQKAPCYHTQWTNQQAQYSDLCYSDLPYLYVGRGFAELDWPYSDAISVRDRYDVMEYPVGISYYACGTAYLTHWLSGSPDIDNRGGFSQDQLSRDPQVRRETMLFVAVTAIGFALCALLAAWFLTGVNRRRPWDAALFAASPVLLFEGLINWDLLAVVCVAGALWAQARGRPALTGVMMGLGTAMKLYPLFLLGALFIVWGRERRWRDFTVATLSGVGTWVVVNAPAFLSGRQEWNVFWTFNSHRGADLGSVWLMVDQMSERHQRGPHHQRRLVGAVQLLVPRRRVARRPGAADAEVRPARLPARGRLPAGQQGVLAAVRAVVAAAGSDGAATSARPADLAVRRALLLLRGLVVPRALPRPRWRRRRGLLLAGDHRPRRGPALPRRDRGARRDATGVRRGPQRAPAGRRASWWQLGAPGQLALGGASRHRTAEVS